VVLAVDLLQLCRGWRSRCFRDGSGLRFALTAKQNYRGTFGVLGEYLQSFDPRLVGLTGTPVQIAAAAKAVQSRIGLRLLALLGPATCPL
jgi:SCO1/SenC